MQTIPEKIERNERLVLIGDSFIRRKLASLDPGHKVPGTAFGNGDLFDASIEEDPLSAFDDTPVSSEKNRVVLPSVHALSIGVESNSAVLIPPRLRACGGTRNHRTFLPKNVNTVREILSKGLQVVGCVQ
jgi:hypothetical protein